MVMEAEDESKQVINHPTINLRFKSEGASCLEVWRESRRAGHDHHHDLFLRTYLDMQDMSFYHYRCASR